MDNVQFDVAEVLSTDVTYNYSETIADQGLFQIIARSVTEHTKTDNYTVLPITLNKIKIPVVGELILVCKTIKRTTQKLNDNDKDKSWYYIQTLGLQGGTNNNKSTGMSWTAKEHNQINNQEHPAGKTFIEQKISSLQPYEGDHIWQGRFGNSIRFGSTISTIPEDNYYHKTPTWSGDVTGDPIIILANGQENLDKKEFVVEDINTDNSSIYLTSTQSIPIVLGSEKQPNSLTGCITTKGHESKYQDSQLLAVSDRIILKARTDLAVIDSPIGIVLNSTGKIKLGSEDAAESMVHGDVLLEVLQSIINQLRTVIQCGSASGTFINLTYAEQAQTQLQELLSSKYFINKSTY
tara:strand:+ start:1521 stop:2573 length:1053 start_codon:yes stop_codon:yes gene_type:complete